MEKIKELCSEERPYEKCERFGAKHLTDIELLAVLLRSGSRGRVHYSSPDIFCIRRYCREGSSISITGRMSSYGRSVASGK